MTDFQVLLKDATLNIVKQVYSFDALAAVKIDPVRYSMVPWTPGAQIAGQRATVEGGPGGWVLAKWDADRKGEQ
jgi:hypothetical protein